ncbi:MAG: Co2+/Mg2+ efflux protein ApaG [Cellvibrionaceae bacterium]
MSVTTDDCTTVSQPIMIKVKTAYLDDHSQPEKKRFAFAYTITIENNSDQPAQLLSRHWIITDANNVVQEVEGMGVVGQQPRILPGDSYTYSSGAVLETQVGTMEGTYQMQSDSGESFNIPIPAFSLTRPHALH